MKVLIKDNNNKVIFESFGKNSISYCEIIEDKYDCTRIETTTQSITDINVNSIKVYRIPNAPEFGKN